MGPDPRPPGVGEILHAAPGLYRGGVCGLLLDAAAVLYRSRFGVLVRYAALIVVPVQAFLAIVLISAQPDNFSVSISGSSQPQFDTNSARLGATAVVLVVGLLTHAFIVAVT